MDVRYADPQAPVRLRDEIVSAGRSAVATHEGRLFGTRTL